ncbi:sensor histidine kinase [Candidatus Formimonas warabiya]|uniref:histidine kinase n=1 Tax=Formimonas warabiya TaxID=1761012 RepID=A0A3G1KMW9_FORW1|nr:HAMP domain-containing sensor histidine kinase [Candidatus Formimonas warabiya]ATW23797.1 two-component sensor histidine kinase [Candidatus Formimonas warabiya]
MRKAKWYKIAAIIILFLIFISCAIGAGSGLSRAIFSATGQPSMLVDLLVSGLISVILMATVILLVFFLYRQIDGGKHSDSSRSKMFENIIDAMSRIAQGDFNVLLSVDNDYGPFTELVTSVNKMATELDSMEKLRQDFISNVSHEFQSPLTSISGYASLLKREQLSQEQITHYATIIEAESKRLSKLSENLLRLSALEADCAPLEYRPVRLDKQLESILLMLEPQWAEKNIMPDVSLPIIRLTGNEDLLNQVWINLIYNAIKFTPENGLIRVMLTSNKDSVVCTIADNGIGISTEDQLHIFERFYKVDKSRDRSLGGNGLGLSLVKKIVEMHGGSITVRSEIGKGAEFIVTLPNHASGKNNS